MSYIINSDAGRVPFGKYAGYELEELVEIDPRYAKWMLEKTRMKYDFPEEYYDLEAHMALRSIHYISHRRR